MGHEKTPRRSAEPRPTQADMNGHGPRGRSAKQNTLVEVKWKPYDPGQEDGAFRNGGETRLV